MTRTISRLFLAIALLVAAPVLGGAAVGAREAQAPTPPEIEILDPGSEPREVLRLAPPVGASERSVMTMRVDLEQSGVSEAAVKAPPIRATIAAQLPDMTPNGDLHVTFSYPSFEVLRRRGVSASQRSAAERSLRDIEGLSGELTLTPQGALVDSTLDIPADADPNVGQLLGQIGDQFRELTVPLPPDGVGVGARWRATSQLELNGIEVRQVEEFRLKERNGPTLELDVRGTQTARRQTVDSPSGVTLRIRSFKTTFRGSTTLDLTRLLPVTSRVRGSGDQTFGVRSGEESGELRQHIELEVTLKPE